MLSQSNRNVFRSHLHCPISPCGWRNSTGKLFHSRGPATENCCFQGMFLYVLIQVSTSADRSQCRPAIVHWAQLILGWVTICGRVNCLGM